MKHFHFQMKEKIHSPQDMIDLIPESVIGIADQDLAIAIVDVITGKEYFDFTSFFYLLFFLIIRNILISRFFFHRRSRSRSRDRKDRHGEKSKGTSGIEGLYKYFLLT